MKWSLGGLCPLLAIPAIWRVKQKAAERVFQDWVWGVGHPGLARALGSWQLLITSDAPSPTSTPFPPEFKKEAPCCLPDSSVFLTLHAQHQVHKACAVDCSSAFPTSLGGSPLTPQPSSFISQSQAHRLHSNPSPLPPPLLLRCRQATAAAGPQCLAAGLSAERLSGASSPYTPSLSRIIAAGGEGYHFQHYPGKDVGAQRDKKWHRGWEMAPATVAGPWHLVDMESNAAVSPGWGRGRTWPGHICSLGSSLWPAKIRVDLGILTPLLRSSIYPSQMLTGLVPSEYWGSSRCLYHRQVTLPGPGPHPLFSCSCGSGG